MNGRIQLSLGRLLFRWTSRRVKNVLEKDRQQPRNSSCFDDKNEISMVNFQRKILDALQSYAIIEKGLIIDFDEKKIYKISAKIFFSSCSMNPFHESINRDEILTPILSNFLSNNNSKTCCYYIVSRLKSKLPLPSFEHVRKNVV